MNQLISKYLEKIIQNNKIVDSRGVMQVNRMIAVELDDIYVSLKLQLNGQSDSPTKVAGDFAGILRMLRGISEDSDVCTRSGSDDLKHEEKFKLDFDDNGIGCISSAITKEIVPLDELWKKGTRWVILGDPGAGKTTLMKYLALSHARQASEADDFYIPLPVTLRNFAQDCKNSGWKPKDTIMNFLCGPFLQDMGFSSHECNDLHNYFELALNNGRVLLLLDGLDEQRNSITKQETNRAIEALLDRYPNIRCVVTSRIIGYDLAPIDSGFRTATLEPFDDAQMALFFNKWFYAIERSEDIVVDASTKKRAEKKAGELIEQIMSNSSVRGLAANPLLCTIIGLIYRQGGSTLPTMRAELYKLCIDTFIFNWEMNKIRKGTEQTSLNKDETQGALESIALYLHENCPENAASKDKLVEIVITFLQEEMGYNCYQSRPRAEQLLELARDVAGLLNSRGNDTYGFFHLTFQEYLTARSITRKRRLITQYLGHYLFSARWREVIRLAAAHQGMKDEESGSEFITAVLKVRHHREDEMQYAFRIAFQCATEARVELDTVDSLLKQWIDLYLNRPELNRLLRVVESTPRYKTNTLNVLFESLSNNDEKKRARAVEALGILKADEAIQPLINMLSDEDDNVRWEVLSALSELNAYLAVEPIMQLLKDKVEFVRWGAARALGALKAVNVTGTLIEMLSDTDSSVRQSAAEALGELKSVESVNYLIKLLSDTTVNVRLEAARALGSINSKIAVDPLIEALQDNSKIVRTFAAQALAKIKGEEIAERLLPLLIANNYKLRHGVALALGELKIAEAVLPLIGLLQDKYSIVRQGAVRALGQFEGFKEVESPLIEALQDKNYEVRRWAILALGKLSVKKAIDPIINALKDENRNVRLMAARTLGSLNDDKAIGALLIALRDKDEYVRSNVARSLGELSAAVALSPLIEALDDEHKFVRSNAIEALGNLKSSEALDKLVNKLCDKNEDIYVRMAAAKSIEHIDMGGER